MWYSAENLYRCREWIPFPGDVEFQCDFDLVRSRMPDRASDRFLRDTVEWHRQVSLAP